MNKSRRYQKLLILITISLFYIFLDLFFLIIDKSPQSWDQSRHLVNSLSIFQYLKDGRFYEAIRLSRYYQPFYYLTTIPIYFFKNYPPYPIFINFLYLIILIFSVYGLASKYFNKRSGLLAALIIASYPFMIVQRRNYLIDFPLTAMVAMAMYFFSESNALMKRKKVILVSVVTALCLLTKLFGIFYLIPFYAVMFIPKYLNSNNKLFLLKNFSIFVLIVFAISSFWYIPNFNHVREGISDLKNYAILEGDPILNLEALTYYLKQFSWQLSPVLFLLTILFGLILLIKNKAKRFIFVVYPSIFLSYIFFVLIPNKDPRYILPLFIYFPLIIAGGIHVCSDKHSFIRKILEFTVVFICIIQSIAVSFGWPNIRANWFPFLNSPNKNDWKVTEIVKEINRESEEKNTLVAVIPDHLYINSGTFFYYSFINNNKQNYISLADPANIDNAEYFIRNSEFIIDADPIVLTASNQTPLYKNVLKAHQTFLSEKNNYKKIQSYQLQNLLTVSIYRRNQ